MGIFDRLFGKKSKHNEALIDAVRKGHTEIVRLLKQAGARK
ncbi:ankyrin repeat domain-containing protein [Thermodesulfovibrionales bacterium]|nr:ankyrin repeat domain-containing protein [Thermodesulfovibrionales bacterium]